MAYEELRSAFREGDVVFGLSEPLMDAVESLRRPRSVRVRTMPLFGKKVTKYKGLIQADITDVVWKSKDPTAYASDKEIRRSLASQMLGTGFRAFLTGHPKYDVASQYREGKLVHGPGRQSPKDLTNAWGRTSKAGLIYHLNRGATVHFVVTDIDLNRVANKTEPDKHLVTSRELRLLYRRRHDPVVQQHVKFYDASGPIDQAAFFARPEWKQYSPKSERSDVAEHDRSAASSAIASNYWSRQLASGSKTSPVKQAASRLLGKGLRRR